jgi:hypothetical protein
MAAYRKIPVIIDAVQWFKHGDHEKVELLPAHARKTWALHPADVSSYGWIRTLEGGHVVTPGDWIIRGVKGEHYACKPDIFALTYEPAE